ncbi:MAG: DUF1566 domain-containing protein [Methylococcales bacterium]|nr:DUF1566 domain-containing protein [Methylococcales bacterium]
MIFLSKIQKTILISAILATTTTHAANQKPIADAGIDQTIAISTNVTLSGIQSNDSDGTIKTYSWLQTKGTKVSLKNPKTVNPTFSSPKKIGTLTFKLTVKDNKNATSTDIINVNVVEKIVIIEPPKKPDVSPPIPTTETKIEPEIGCQLPQITQNGSCVSQFSETKFNDTGITFCSDGAFNVNSCDIKTYPRQDAEFGRDVLNNDNKDGHAGFSFTKISATGEKLPLEATNWACIQDNVTGFLWEVKTAQNQNERYSFSNTDKFVQEKNNEKLCGVTNWRLPDIHELQSIVDYSVPFPNPTIDLNFFPNSTNQIYWSVTPYAKNPNDVWGIYFDDGRVYEQDKNTQAAIRLVSANVTSKKYVISDNQQEVLDMQTGLIWRRCIEGLKWNGTTCSGSPFYGMFQESLERAANQARLTGKPWRVPSVKELGSLADQSQSPIAIDSVVFPATVNDQFWSASSYAMDAFFGWMTHFYYGATYYSYSEDTGAVRLVRN